MSFFQSIIDWVTKPNTLKWINSLIYIGEGITNFLIDMEDSKVVNSIGVSILIELIEKLQTVDGKLAFTNLAAIVEKTFNIMGLTKYCEVYDSVDSGVDNLS